MLVAEFSGKVSPSSKARVENTQVSGGKCSKQQWMFMGFPYFHTPFSGHIHTEEVAFTHIRDPQCVPPTVVPFTPIQPSSQTMHTMC